MLNERLQRGSGAKRKRLRGSGACARLLAYLRTMTLYTAPQNRTHQTAMMSEIRYMLHADFIQPNRRTPSDAHSARTC